MVQPMLQIIATSKGIPMNEYIMRLVARIFAFLGPLGAEAGLKTLGPLAQILIAMSANPTNPVFNHNLFEAIASIAKVCVPTQPDPVEAALLPAFGQIMERNVTDFLPYTLQIFGLLLDASQSVKPLYQELFGRLLQTELWRAHANIPGLVRLLRAYFAKHQTFGELIRQNMQGILERFQFILMNRKTETAAIDLFNAMISQLPLEFYQAHLRTIMTVLLTRLQSTQSPKFKRDFVVSCSLLSHRQPNPVLSSVLNEIQPGLLVNLLQGVWPPVLKMPLKLDERKVAVLAIAKFLAQDDVRSNPQVMNHMCVGLVSLLGLLPSASVATEDASDDEGQPADGGAGLDFEVSFSKLRNTDLPGASAGLAPDVPDLPSAAKNVLRPHLQAIGQLLQQNQELQPLALFLQ